MGIEKKEKDGCTITLRIKVDEIAVEEEFKRSFERLSRQIKTKGFRKGKVPRSVIESRFSKQAEEEVLETLLQKATVEALEEDGISPIAGPWINKEDLSFGRGKPLFFSAKMEVEPEFEIPDWRNIKLSRKKREIKDKDVERALADLLERKATFLEKIGPVEKGDVAVIDYIAYLKTGEEKKGFGIYIEVGKKLFPEKLEKELIGMRVGEKKSFKVKMPKETRDASLSGKEVEFSLHLIAVKEKHLPELSCEFAKEMGCQDMEELRRNIEEDLKKTQEALMKISLKAQMKEELLKRCSFPLPQSMVSARAQTILDTLLYNLKKEGRSLEDYLASQKKGEEELKREIIREAEKITTLFYILNRIGGIEGIEITDAELEEWARLNLAKDRLNETLSNKERRERLKAELRIEKVLDWMVENSK